MIDFNEQISIFAFFSDSAHYNDQDDEEKAKSVEEKLLSSPENDEVQEIPYPKRVFLILGTEFCERFNYYGMRSILTVFFSKKYGHLKCNNSFFTKMVSYVFSSRFGTLYEE